MVLGPLINDKCARCIRRRRRYDIYPAPTPPPLPLLQPENPLKKSIRSQSRQLKPLNPAGAAWAHNLKQKLTQLDNKTTFKSWLALALAGKQGKRLSTRFAGRSVAVACTEKENVASLGQSK